MIIVDYVQLSNFLLKCNSYLKMQVTSMKIPKLVSLMTLDVLKMVHIGNIRFSLMSSSSSNNMLFDANEKGRTIPKNKVLNL